MGVELPIRGTFPSHSRRGNTDGKVCTVCDEWKPLKEYYRRSSGGYQSECTQCRKIMDGLFRDPNRRTYGLVPWEGPVRNVFKELVNRVGKAETGRLCGMSKSTISRYTNHPPRSVQRETARIFIEALIDVRASGVVLHRDSIIHGAFERGRMVKIPSARKHFYRKHGDDDSWRKRMRRRLENG